LLFLAYNPVSSPPNLLGAGKIIHIAKDKTQDPDGMLAQPVPEISINLPGGVCVYIPGIVFIDSHALQKEIVTHCYQHAG
jgi:hypothetical protein